MTIDPSIAHTGATTEPRTLADRLSTGSPPNLVDVRSPTEYAAVHARGARLVPLDQLDPAAVLADRSDGTGPVYLICKSGARATQAQRRFAAAGFATDAVVVTGGIDAWVAAGCPVVRGRPAPMAMERQVRIVAGALVVLGTALGWGVDRWFFLLSTTVGAGLVFAGITNTCGMARVLARMPWNRRA